MDVARGRLDALHDAGPAMPRLTAPPRLCRRSNLSCEPSAATTPRFAKSGRRHTRFVCPAG